MFCGKCGAQNPDENMFCYSCGARLFSGQKQDSEKHQQGGTSQGRLYDTDVGYDADIDCGADYGNSDQVYKGNVVAVTAIPMLPDGRPYERDDYLAVSTEYKRQKIYNSTVWILLLFFAVIVSFALSVTFVNFLGIVCKLNLGVLGFLILLAVGILLSFLLGRLSNSITKKRLNKIGDTLYQRYLELFNQSNHMSIST